MNRGRKRIIGWLHAAGAATIVFSIATAAGFSHHSVQLFTHFRLQYFLASICLAVALFFVKSNRLAAVLSVTAIFNGFHVYEWYVPDDEQVFADAQFKVMHANVHSSSDAYDSLLNSVLSEDPEIVFLQEFTAGWANATSTLSARYPYSYLQPRAGNFGIAVYSKLPFQDVRHVDSPPFGHPTIIVIASVADQPVTFVSTHPMIPVGQTLFDARNQQFDSIINAVAGMRGPVVLLGDLNESVWGASYEKLITATGLRDARRGFGTLPSWPTFFPPAMIPIDHILISDEIGVVDMQRTQSIGSDHLPLVATLAL